ncbi:MAG: SIS domain-containing protein [Elusimicrobiota bacterium]|nr:SIS domain-containing protein [Elusimicrobiota bacterium]
MNGDRPDIKSFQEKYVSDIRGYLDCLRGWDLEYFVNAIKGIQGTTRKVILIGNGGSALNAAHFAMGLSIVTKKWARPIRTVCLSEHAAQITSIGNDYSFEDVYSKQLEVHLDREDILVIFSSSGNSRNLIKAARYARSKGSPVICFLGGSGGELADLCTKKYHVPVVSKDPGQAEDIHMIAGHIVTQYIEYHLDA